MRYDFVFANTLTPSFFFFAFASQLTSALLACTACVVGAYLRLRPCMVVDTRVHGLVNAFGWARTAGGVRSAKPYAEHGDVRQYPVPGWHVNTSGDAVSLRRLLPYCH